MTKGWNEHDLMPTLLSKNHFISLPPNLNPNPNPNWAAVKMCLLQMLSTLNIEKGCTIFTLMWNRIKINGSFVFVSSSECFGLDWIGIEIHRANLATFYFVGHQKRIISMISWYLRSVYHQIWHTHVYVAINAFHTEMRHKKVKKKQKNNFTDYNAYGLPIIDIQFKVAIILVNWTAKYVVSAHLVHRSACK